MSVPSINSPSFKTPSPATHGQLANRDGGNECWRCGIRSNDMIDVAHQLFAHETERFLEYQDEPLCLIPQQLTHPAHISNLILLCKNCHSAFDAHSPSWVLVPNDLEFFITWEMDDYERRVNAANEGTRLRRTVPAAADYHGNTYIAYTIRAGALAHVPDTRFPRFWGGAPTAVLFKSLAGAFQPSSTMPSETRTKICTLSNLYSRPTPILKLKYEEIRGSQSSNGGSEHTSHGNGRGDEASGTGKQSRRGGRGRSGRRGRGKKAAEGPPSRKRARSAVDGPSSHVTADIALESEIYETPPVSPSLIASRGAPKIPVDQPWMWGPQLTANDAVIEFSVLRDR